MSLFGSTTFQLFLICFRFLSPFFRPYESTGHMSGFSNFMLVFSNSFPDCFQFHCNFLGSSYYCLMSSDQLPAFGLMTSIYLNEFTFSIVSTSTYICTLAFSSTTIGLFCDSFNLSCLIHQHNLPFVLCCIFPVEICHRLLYHVHTANLKYIFQQQQCLISTIRLISCQIVSRMISFLYAQHRRRGRIHPCCTPFFMKKGSTRDPIASHRALMNRALMSARRALSSALRDDHAVQVCFICCRARVAIR